MAQERTRSTVVLRLQAIREIREIRGQNHLRERQSDRVCPDRNDEKSTQEAL